MMFSFKKFNFRAIAAGVVLAVLQLLAVQGSAQGIISGPRYTCPGVTQYYTSTVSGTWSVTGGTMVPGGASKTVGIVWDATADEWMIEFGYRPDKWSDPVEIFVYVNRSTPGQVWLKFLETTCVSRSGKVVVFDHTGSIVRWESSTDYQNWTPIPYTGAEYTFPGISQNTLFRAVTDGGSCGLYYSSAYLVHYSPVPPKPTVTSARTCAGTPTTLTATGTGYSFQWYEADGVTQIPAATNATYSPPTSMTRNFYVCAKSYEGCEGEKALATVTVDQLPAVPPDPDLTQECGRTIVTMKEPRPGDVYIWSYAYPTHTTGTSRTFAVDTSQLVFASTRDTNTGCYSYPFSPMVVNVQVIKKPAAPPAPSLAEQCRKTVLNSQPPPDGVKYFWQTTPEGTSDGYQGTYTAVSSGTYYLRAALTNITNCWSPAIGVPVTVKERMSCIDGQNINYVVTNNILKEGVKDVSSISSLLVNDNEQTVSYLDGFGRPVQVVIPEGSPQKKDVVQMITYDRFGRESKHYLPYTASSDGRYATDALSRLTQFYSQAENVAYTTAPWSETRFEASPLAEIVEKSSPGEDWQIGSGHEIKMSRRLNVQNEVRLWVYDFATGQCTTQGYYEMNQLRVEETTQDHHKAWIFSDKQGRTVFTKVQVSATETACTYNVYDAFSQLRMVIQPEGVKELLKTNNWSLTTAFIDKWCFVYQYDGYGRLIEKKLPGAQPVYTVYNNRHLPVLSQDGKQRIKNEWSFIKYDAHNRPVLTGTYTHSGGESQALMQRAADSFVVSFEVRAVENYNTQQGYTITRSFPVLSDSNHTILTVTYYDDYNFNNDATTADVSYISSGMVPEPIPSDQTMNRITGTKTRILGSEQLLLTASFFDARGNLIQVQKENHLGGKDINSMRYDFADKVLESRQTHQGGTGSPLHVIRKQFAYDHAGRTLKIHHQVNGNTPVILSYQQYSELGQVVKKSLHSTDGQNYKQTLNYKYNIRGWLTGINHPDPVQADPSDLFGMQLFYNAVPAHGGVPRYNGDISEIIYNNLAVDQQKAYVFNYDTLNRMIHAKYLERTASGLEQAGTFDEKLTYDLNGNIKTLQRYALAGTGAARQLVDQLSYAYEGNKLLAVEDAGNKEAGFLNKATEAVEYQYDENGYMTRDRNKEIDAVTYNSLNLMESIVFPGKGQIGYTCDATGTRLGKTVNDLLSGTTKTRNYINGFEYNGTQLEFFGTEEGRVVMTGGTPEYQYHLKDHLGNVRLTFTAKEETLSTVASLEFPRISTEQSQFLRYDAARRVFSSLFDKTKGALPGFAQRLNGSANEKYGLARSLSVMPGDHVRLEVFAKYVDPDRTNWSQALTNLVTAIANGTAPAGNVVDGAAYNTSTASFSYPGLLNKSNSTGNGPKAFLNWLVFDRNFNLLDAGYRRMSTAAREYGQDVAHEKLEAELPIRHEGYVYVYLSNEESAPLEVYFDDLSVTQLLSPVVSTAEYYPFGETFNEYQREYALDQKYLYNGKEKQDEFNFNLFDHGARMYDPLLARWNGLDPLAEKYATLSPFAYVANNPIKYVDPDGRKIVVVGSEEFKKKYAQAVAYLTKHNANWILEALGDKNEKVYELHELTDDRVSHVKGGTKIHWNPNIAFVTSEDYVLTGAEVLNHELAHIYRWLNAKSLDDLRGEDWGVIGGEEQETAGKIGRLKKDGRTRTKHSDGTPIVEEGPTSTKASDKYINERKERERKQKEWQRREDIRSYKQPGMTWKQAEKLYEQRLREAKEREKEKTAPKLDAPPLR